MNAANAANRAPRSHRATDAQSGAGDQGAAREAPRYGLNFVDAGRLPDPPIHTKKNDTDLPESLKLGIESLSGVSLDSVKVHYNSPQPARLDALAYAQGSEIHVAPGQEKHLPHEAWHVVQQLQGRVRPTTRVSGRAVNNDSALEQQAETMGSRAADAGQTALTGASHVGDMRLGPAVGRNGGDAPRFLAASAGGVIQRNKRGVKLLGLAKPKLFQFPEPKRERKASAAIERIATQNLAFRFQANNPNSIFAEFTVCGVLLPENLDQKDSKLIGAGQVVNVIGPAAQDMQQYFPSDLKKSIAKIVMQTLLLADQIDYLRETDLTAGNNRVLVEVHYYYNRPPSFAGRWHKDTRGDTMFVNLNYINPESPIPGPEYLVNPHTTEEHARQRRELVPDSFLTDLEFAQDNLDEPTEIGWGMVPTYGVVSFVDELIHHTTPLAGGRKVSAEQLSGDPARGLVAPEERLALSDLASAANNPVYDRLDLESAGLSPETASILLNAFAAENYKSVGIFYLPHRQPLTADGNTSRLTRRMSVSGRDVTDPPPDARRSFFRTWVRSVTAGIGYIT